MEARRGTHIKQCPRPKSRLKHIGGDPTAEKPSCGFLTGLSRALHNTHPFDLTVLSRGWKPRSLSGWFAILERQKGGGQTWLTPVCETISPSSSSAPRDPAVASHVPLLSPRILPWQQHTRLKCCGDSHMKCGLSMGTMKSLPLK